MSTDKFPHGMRTVTEKEWEAYMDRLDAGAMEPCDHWSINECFCKGACGCHWKPEEKTCGCQERWDFTFYGDGKDTDIVTTCVVVTRRIVDRYDAETIETNVGFDEIIFGEQEDEG